jgi:hypothetical protein
MKKIIIIAVIFVAILGSLNPLSAWYANQGFTEKNIDKCMTAAGIKKAMLNFSGASKVYSKIIKYFPNSASMDDARYFYAFCLERDHETHAAISAYRQYLGAHPSGQHANSAQSKLKNLIALQQS